MAPEPASTSPRQDLESIEIRMLLEAVYQQYGYDFRKYARGSLRRRLWRRADAEGVKTISGLQERVLHNPVAMEALLMDLSVNVTAMFRDPTFYVSLRRNVVPILKTYPFIRIWNAGCSTGEEVYSIAILLQEEGLLDRARIYATDINERVLERADEGIIPLDRMRTFTQNYQRAGGSEVFSQYYKAQGTRAHIERDLLRNVVFAHHNLVSDRSFNEFHLIICRNVMIYFDKELQDEVHGLFLESLVKLGILALGNKESIRFSSVAPHYEELDAEEKIYRRAR